MTCLLFVKPKTAYERCISDWSSDVCSSDLLLEWADAVGLAGYAVFGTAKAMAWGVPPAPALLMGVITGCVGGTIRDILAGVPSIIMRPEIYVTAAALASGLYLLLTWAGAGTATAPLAGALPGFLLRGAASRGAPPLHSYPGGPGGLRP